MRLTLAALARQPMAQFLVGGALIFGVYSAVGKPEGEADAPGAPAVPRAAPLDPTLHIHISRGQVESMAASFAARWLRPPTQQELSGLMEEHVRETMVVREALRLGLDRDDPVIRRHLRVRMEFIAQDVGVLAEPSDEELTAFLHKYQERFRQPMTISFQQIFIDRQARGEAGAAAEAARILELLRGANGPRAAAEEGDRFLLGDEFRDVPGPQLRRDFGDGFLDALGTAPVGEWAGPFASTYGLHLVRLHQREEGAMPRLDQVRPIVRAEFESLRRQQALETFHRGLLSRYTVTVEQAPAQP